MKVAYHFMIPCPPMPELDGAVQEASWLQKRFGGSIHYLYPARRFRRWIPPTLCGVRQLSELRALDRAVDVHHLFSPGLRSYPALVRLRKPVVYTLLTGLESPARLQFSAFWKRVSAVVVPDLVSARLLSRSGHGGIEIVPPGIELERFSLRSPPPSDDFVLLAGSAPWSLRQFATKGYDILLDAVSALPRLRLVLLWRGMLGEEMERRVRERGLGSRVEILHQSVDVAQVLHRVHAAVALARSPTLLKAFPHSLLEALAAGRPIVTSAGLAIADLVEQTGAGVVVEQLSPEALIGALRQLMSDYPVYRNQAEDLDLGEFSRERFLDEYERIYRRSVSTGELP